MTIASLSTPHSVSWDSLPPSLQPEVETTARKAARIAWNIISVLIPIIGLVRLMGYGLACMARKYILMANSQDDLFAMADNMLAGQADSHPHFTSIPTTVISPDGTELSVHLFRHKKADKNTPTTIVFGGNGHLKGLHSNIYEAIMKEAVDRGEPMNVVTFDYRSVNHSKGTFTQAQDFLVDGASIVDYVRKKLGTPDDQIHFHGYSLGGAVSLKVKAADPKLTGKLMSDCSFSTIGEVVEHFILKCSYLLKPIALLAKWVLRVQGLELDAAADLPKLKGKTWVVYHPLDPVIPFAGSLASKFKEKCREFTGPPCHGTPFDGQASAFLFR